MYSGGSKTGNNGEVLLYKTGRQEIQNNKTVAKSKVRLKNKEEKQVQKMDVGTALIKQEEDLMLIIALKYSKYSWSTWLIVKVCLKFFTYAFLLSKNMDDEAHNWITDWGPLVNPLVFFVFSPVTRLLTYFYHVTEPIWIFLWYEYLEKPFFCLCNLLTFEEDHVVSRVVMFGTDLWKRCLHFFVDWYNSTDGHDLMAWTFMAMVGLELIKWVLSLASLSKDLGRCEKKEQVEESDMEQTWRKVRKRYKPRNYPLRNGCLQEIKYENTKKIKDHFLKKSAPSAKNNIYDVPQSDNKNSECEEENYLSFLQIIIDFWKNRDDKSSCFIPENIEKFKKKFFPNDHGKGINYKKLKSLGVKLKTVKIREDTYNDVYITRDDLLKFIDNMLTDKSKKEKNLSIEQIKDYSLTRANLMVITTEKQLHTLIQNLGKNKQNKDNTRYFDLVGNVAEDLRKRHDVNMKELTAMLSRKQKDTLSEKETIKKDNEKKKSHADHNVELLKIENTSTDDSAGEDGRKRKIRECWLCSTLSRDLLKCSGCRKGRYCNDICYRTDWVNHVEYCLQVQARRNNKLYEEKEEMVLNEDVKNNKDVEKDITEDTPYIFSEID